MTGEELYSIRSLRNGDIVRSKASGLAYVVTLTHGDTAIAVRTIEVSHANEWLVMRDDSTKVKR